jgi:hypothetical protein
MLLGSEKECSAIICSNVDRPGGYSSEIGQAQKVKFLHVKAKKVDPIEVESRIEATSQ